MSKFIKLTNMDGDSVYQNVDRIIFFHRSGKGSSIKVVNDGEGQVTETPEQIIAIINQATAEQVRKLFYGDSSPVQDMKSSAVNDQASYPLHENIAAIAASVHGDPRMEDYVEQPLTPDYCQRLRWYVEAGEYLTKNEPEDYHGMGSDWYEVTDAVADGFFDELSPEAAVRKALEQCVPPRQPTLKWLYDGDAIWVASSYLAQDDEHFKFRITVSERAQFLVSESDGELVTEDEKSLTFARYEDAQAWCEVRNRETLNRLAPAIKRQPAGK